MVAATLRPIRREAHQDARIVAIGASAGGLVAIEQFLTHIPPASGLAYVVVQHLDPTQKALLPELLQRVTAMPVHEAEQSMPIAPDCVYVIPPNTELSVTDNVLRLTQPTAPRGLRLPINVLFSSLARARGEHAIAVVLSGMGSDGTIGVQAIKAAGGLTLAQAPDTAQFEAMPASAIDSGCIDIVGPAAELPVRIQAYVRRLAAPVVASDEAGRQAALPSPLQRVLRLLRQHTRHDFSAYKPNTLNRRVERRMAIHGIVSLEHYAEFLTVNPQECDLLFKELLIGVTSFFRDAPVWTYLVDIALPRLLAQRPPPCKLRVWSVGCSTGEEAYSLAMVFREALDHVPQSQEVSLQIFASDMSPDAIATARRGKYPRSIDANVSPERLARFFTLQHTDYQINKNIRDTILFAQHDAALDPPFTRLDFISCRNLLIYFDQNLQRQLLLLFHYSLRPGGLLLLGSSETIGRLGAYFTPEQSKLRLYVGRHPSKQSGADSPVSLFPPLSQPIKEHTVSHDNVRGTHSDSLKAAVDEVLLQGYAPAAVLLNPDGDIVYISGRTGKYLEPTAGKANWNIHFMAREGLRTALAAALRQAATQPEPVQVHGLHMQGGTHPVDLTVQALCEPRALQGTTLIVFRDVVAAATAGRSRRRTKTAIDIAHAAEIQRYVDDIQTLRDEGRASKEELQSTNEELQSTNEELQSANEELTTSKEEMQSMNEELQTINAELQSKLDDLAQAQSDMKNLLNSIEIAILFLDQDLNVRRYTDRAAALVNLREGDVGRPLSDLTTSLQYADLLDDALATLHTLQFSEKQIPTTDGRWFTVRIMPYRRLDDVIDGLVITLVDITTIKQLEAALRRQAKT